MPKMLVTDENHKFIVKEEDKDLHTNYGMISKEDINKASSGDIVKSNKGKEFTVMEASFMDLYSRIKRGAQIIPQKDIGLIITEAGLNKDSVVIEAGSGSGASGCFLAKVCKKLYSYEIREDFFKIVQKNIEYLGLKNMTLKNKDAKLGFDETDADCVVLDLPDPWEFIEIARKSLKVGGFLVSYSPTIPQVMDFVDKLNSDFLYIKTSEILEREWEINKRKVRPLSQGIGHSGFLSFARRVK
jgi:tRNA (adenine57-N1/adenine58-N1)-methyltransferase catalytic subunit